MMRRTHACSSLVPACGLRCTFAQHEGHGAMAPDQIGSASVKFETSCAPAVKDDFNKAVALLHSFWFPEATQDVRRRSLDDGSELRDGALGHRAEPVGQSVRRAAAGAARSRLARRSIDKAQATGSPTPREKALHRRRRASCSAAPIRRRSAIA